MLQHEFMPDKKSIVPTVPEKILPPRPVPVPDDLPPNGLTLPPIKHPCRCSILGTMHTVAELRNIIAARDDISDELKAVVLAEVAQKTSNAAKVDMHVVDHANGDSSIHIHVAQIKLG